MGMWNKDKLYGGERLADHVTIGESPIEAENVVLFDIAIVSDEVPTDLGFATKTAMVIGKLEGDKLDGAPLTVNTLAQAIAQKAREKSDDDLPAVVCFFTTPASKEGWSDATVMQFVRRYDGRLPSYEPLAESIPY